MSDYTGAQTPVPRPAGPDGTPPGDKIPVWVIVAVVLAVAALAATSTLLLTQGPLRQEQARLEAAKRSVADLATKVDQLSEAASQAAVAASTPPAVVTPPPSPPAATPAAPKPKTTKEWSFVTGGGSSGGKLFVKADYIYFYSGAAAVAAHAKYGGSLRPDGSYTRNTSATIRTLALSPTAKISLVEWLETGTPGSSWKLGAADPVAFASVLAGTASSPSGVWTAANKALLLTVTGTTVTEVKQYTPGP